MTSLFDLNENSSDSEDDHDYVPDVELSDKDISEDDELTSSDDENHKLSKTKKSTKKRSRRKQLCDKDEEKKSQEVKETPANEKAKADDIWKSFLAVVSETPKKEVEENPISVIASAPVIPATLASCTEGNTSVSNSSSKCTAEKTCKIFEFAGETISVPKDVSVSDIISFDSNSSKTDALVEKEKDEPAPPAKRKGLQSVLGTIMNKKAKITTLQKSLIDWRSYKKDEGIEEELEKFNRGKGGFIERQKFLQRSDVRSYELERDLRLTKVKKT